MRERVIRTSLELRDWIRERSRHDMDFDPDLHVSWLPFLVVWAEVEANGCPDVEYDHFTGDRLRHLADKVEDG